MTSIDTSELRAFASSLVNAAPIAEKEATAVVHKGANNIKNQMNGALASSTHFRGIAGSVNYDMRSGGAFGGGFIEAEIGPDHARGGALANVAFFGTSRGGGTVEDPQMALDAEAPRFEKALADLAEKAIR